MPSRPDDLHALRPDDLHTPADPAEKPVQEDVVLGEDGPDPEYETDPAELDRAWAEGDTP